MDTVQISSHMKKGIVLLGAKNGVTWRNKTLVGVNKANNKTILPNVLPKWRISVTITVIIMVIITINVRVIVGLQEWSCALMMILKYLNM